MKKRDKEDLGDAAFVIVLTITISLMPMVAISFMQGLLRYNVSLKLFNYVGGIISVLSCGVVMGLLYIMLEVVGQHFERRMRKNESKRT